VYPTKVGSSGAGSIGGSTPPPLQIMKGYKAMIRDRCPYVVNLALKWCTEFGRLANQEIESPKDRFQFKVKTRWVDRVYQEYVAIYTTNDEKGSSVRKALGIHDGKQIFNFAESINLELINKTWNPIEYKFWIWVNSWVNWFMENYKYIENAYKISGGDNDNWKQLVRTKASYLDGYLDDFIGYLERSFKQ
jgi:hypothetical protein